MAPPYVETSFDGFPPGGAGTSNTQNDGQRIDSPLETRKVVPQIQETQAIDDQPLAVRGRKDMSAEKRSRSADTGNDFRFFVVSHPKDLQDKEQMRANRQHVMHNYLGRERARPDSKDPRVTGAGNGKRRKRIEINRPSSSANTTAPSNIFIDESRLTPASSDYSNASSQDSMEKGKPRKSVNALTSPEHARKHKSSDGSQALARASRRPATPMEEPPLVAGFGGSFENSDYLRRTADRVPFPLAHLGGKLNPFNTWPTFDDPRVDVSELKWNCSRRFGSQGIAYHWVPTLLRARHAFLSTICISSAHDDIMSRAAKPLHLRPQHESFERARVRSEVTQMIQECLIDPELSTADATIIAVLHLLNSEIMGCNDRSMRAHQQGLHTMVQQRGGLTSLGVNGQLASILTITMYLIAVLRETLPQRDFIAYAAKQRTKPSLDTDPLPESPAYCRRGGFYTINKAVAPGSRIHSILDDMRSVTNAFLADHGQCAQSKHSAPSQWQDPQDDVRAVRDRVFALPHCEMLSFPTMSDRYMYEAIRLTSRIYTHALANKLRFSDAAAALRISTTAPTPSSSTQHERSDRSSSSIPQAMHVQVKNAIQRTNTTDCWGHMIGVLFWISLVAGAAANPGSLDDEDRVGEDEDARKWLAAVAVRCSIVLSFEYGSAMLETLKRMVAIEEVLAKGDEELWEEIIAGVTGAYGPVEVVSVGAAPPAERAPVVQKGFADFAHDFALAT